MSAATRLLSAATPLNAAAERARLVAVLARGETPPEPEWRYPPAPDHAELRQLLDRARALAPNTPAADLHTSRLDEIELELDLLAAMPERSRVLPLAARRHGAPTSLLPNGETVLARTRPWLAQSAEAALPENSPLFSYDATASVLTGAAEIAGLDVEVRITPSLAALAAAGDRVLFLSASRYSHCQVLRLVAHEILGHLTSAFNGRAQPLRLLEHGVAGSFEDQEGLCLWLERQSGTFGPARRRTLALRVDAASKLYDGASFGEACIALHRAHAAEPEEIVRAVERSYRAGGAAARDVGYILGLDRVDRLVAERGDGAAFELRTGRISVALLSRLPELLRAGLARPAPLRPAADRVLDWTRRELESHRTDRS